MADCLTEYQVLPLCVQVSAFLPVPELTRADAVDLCRKFGAAAHIAGDFEDRADFDAFYAGLYANQRYLDQCGFYDNGRLLTWLPYTHTSDRSDTR